METLIISLRDSISIKSKNKLGEGRSKRSNLIMELFLTNKP